MTYFLHINEFKIDKYTNKTITDLYDYIIKHTLKEMKIL